MGAVYGFTKFWLSGNPLITSAQNYSNNICIGRRRRRRCVLMLQFNIETEKPSAWTIAGSIASDAPVRQWLSVDKLGARYDLFMKYIPIPILL